MNSLKADLNFYKFQVNEARLEFFKKCKMYLQEQEYNILLDIEQKESIDTTDKRLFKYKSTNMKVLERLLELNLLCSKSWQKGLIKLSF